MRAISPIFSMFAFFLILQNIAIHDALPVATIVQPNAQETVCPPVNDELQCSNASQAKNECESDKDCEIENSQLLVESTKACCYNGCVLICVEKSKPPPVIDWLVEPKPEGNSKYFWLNDDNDKESNDEKSIDDSDYPADCTINPLSDYDLDDDLRRICADGYECILFDEGDFARGIPGRGWCRSTRKYVL